MKLGKIVLVLCAVLALSGAVGIPAVSAASTVGVVLTFDETLLDGGTYGVSRAVNDLGQPIYLSGDAIALRLSLLNTGMDDVVTTYGFGSLPYHLTLVFVGPDGRETRSDERYGDLEPGPAAKVFDANNRYVQVAPVEILSGGSNPWARAKAIPDAHDLYTLSQVGRYTAKSVISFRQYPGVDYTDASSDPVRLYSALGSALPVPSLVSNTIAFSIVDDQDCDGYFFPDGCASCPRPASCPAGWVASAEADCDDHNPNVHPGAPEVPDGVVNNCDPNGVDALGEKGNVAVRADLHKVGLGNYPGSTKEPLRFLRVRVMDRSPGSCVFQQGLSWRNYEAIWKECPIVAEGTTDTSGEIFFPVDPGSYAVFAWYPAGAEEVYMGGGVDPVAANQTVKKYLQAIQKADGKKSPAKYTVLTGSELMIIEPEFVEWTAEQELYPFIFQALGDWGVTTSIAPPNGFVADHPELSAEVLDAIGAVQFVVTDVGSDWVDTEVEYTVKHKNKVKKIKSRIGVRKNKKDKNN